MKDLSNTSLSNRYIRTIYPTENTLFSNTHRILTKTKHESDQISKNRNHTYSLIIMQ